MSDEQSERKLLAWNANDEVAGVDSHGYPMKGHRVKVFWENLGSWHKATVKRWSDREKKWVHLLSGDLLEGYLKMNKLISFFLRNIFSIVIFLTHNNSKN